MVMEGKLGKIKCVCGFTDYCTHEAWNKFGVWAFRWWINTNYDLPCLCPRCGKVDMANVEIESEDFGILVISEECNAPVA